MAVIDTFLNKLQRLINVADSVKTNKAINRNASLEIENVLYANGITGEVSYDDLLTLNDHNLVLITERDRLGDTVYEIDRYMRIQTLTLSKLQEVEKLGGISGVQKFLKSLRVPKHDYTQSEHYEFLENKLPKTEDFER